MGEKSETDYDAKILGLADRAITLAPDYYRPYEFKSVYLSISHRSERDGSAPPSAGLAVNPNQPNLYRCASDGERFRLAISTRPNPTCNRQFG